MDLGLYWMKYPFRKMIGFLLPMFKNSNPNYISIALMPVGILMACVYYTAIANEQYYLYLVGVLLGCLRMVVATLDGLVACEYDKSSVVGDILNRVTPELCDLMLIPAIVIAHNDFELGVLVLVFSWATPFIGMLGAPSKINVQSVGPVGQTDRLAAIMLFSILQYFSCTLEWKIDFISYLFYWLILGGVITLLIRFSRILSDAKKLDATK